MFLKSLEMVGFKSFGDRTLIEFHKGMTAIVGPNGCGKSNVLDAVRWVLGEQSARALRGANMQDVIFNGTDGRKPLGFAEVSLTFSDCEKELGTDYHEVRITRRVFRDGQSEYEINKTPCRLRDIHQLFMDTGIGRTAYSIMEQGKIDAILSSKPEDRRAVFEEAAGITRFKAQKKEALRKLELTESNLLRVSDVIREVSRQIGSLQRQAAKARRYKEFSEKLRSLDTKLASRQFHTLSAHQNETQQKLESFRQQLNTLQLGIDESDAVLRQKRIDLINVEDQIKAFEQRRMQAQQQEAQARQSIQFSHERLSEWDATIQRNRIEIASTEEKVSFQQTQLEQLLQEIQNLSSQVDQARQQQQERQRTFEQAKQNVYSITAKRDDADALIRSCNRDSDQARNRMAQIEAEQRSHLLRIEKLNEDEASWQQRKTEATSAHQQSQARLEELQASLAQLIQQVDERRSALDSARERRKQLRVELEQAERQLTSLTAKHQTLLQLINSHAGYSETTRVALQRFGTDQTRGTLLDQLQVQSGYERAIELCLDKACEAVLVNANVPWDSVLENLQGMAVLASEDQWSSSQGETPDHSQSAWRFVQAQEHVRGWVHRLLQNCLIAHDSAHAHQLRQEMPHALVITQAGEIFHPNGWQVRGHAKQQTHSILARTNELKEIETELEKIKQTVATQQQLTTSARTEQETLETQLHELQAQVQQNQAQVNSTRYELDQHARRINELDSRYHALTQEREQISKADHSGAEELQRCTQLLTQKAEEIQKATQLIDELTRQLAEANHQAEDAAHQVVETKIALATLEQRLNSTRQQQQPTEQRLHELKESMASKHREIADYQSRSEQAQRTIVECEQQIAGTQETLQALGTDLDQLQQTRSSAQAECQTLEEGLSRQRKEHTTLNQLASREEVTLAECTMHMQALTERMQRSYQMSVEELQQQTVEEEANWEQVEAEVQELRQKVESMGPVNIDAITEYEELEQRHNFLLAQEKDLTESKAQLVDAIRKINETTKVMFAETFQQIQANFSQIFVELFGGGRASLVLVDEQDPLESGIDIVAKPPGKQLQPISLLSGGERAMTAVALLFSIYMVKPSPFCILDEMDAPLDESNIGRFIHMLQRFVQQSQFVVITHNKKTIAAADILYGVTMEEHGVSKIVSVKLTRREEDPLFAASAPQQETAELTS